MNKAVAKLPEKQRSAIMLRDYEGHDYRSIGDITGTLVLVVDTNPFSQCEWGFLHVVHCCKYQLVLVIDVVSKVQLPITIVVYRTVV